MEDRDDEGQFREQYPRDAFISAVESLAVASTQKVADEVGCSYDLAYRRLLELEEEGIIAHEDVGQAFVWIKTDTK